MKINLNFKDKKFDVDVDAEKLIEKKMDIDAKSPNPHRYIMRQEEKRKTMELRFWQREEARKHAKALAASKSAPSPSSPKKTRFQLRQEEKRKTREQLFRQKEEEKRLEYRMQIINMLLGFGAMFLLLILLFVIYLIAE